MYDLPIWVNIFIILNEYWYAFAPALVGIMGLVFVRLFTFKLLTRLPHEIVLILSPGKSPVYKVLNHYDPFFITKRGTYWFGEPLNVIYGETLVAKKQKKVKLPSKPKAPSVKGKTKEQAQKIQEEYEEAVKNWEQVITAMKRPRSQDEPEYRIVNTGSKIHVYVDEINQPVYDLTKRYPSKLSDLVDHHGLRVEVRGHQPVIPSKISFGRNWILTINPKTKECLIEKTKKKQPYRLGFFMRFGVQVIKETQEVATSSSATSQAVESITIQNVIEKLGGNLIKNANMSAGGTIAKVKFMKFMDKNYARIVSGGIDPKILLILVLMIGAIAMFFLVPKLMPGIESLGPPPPGVDLPTKPSGPLGLP